jgi:hypothetical protein
MTLHVHTILAWAVAHPEAALAASAALVALLRALYALVSRVVAPYPRLRAAVEALAALGPDVLRAVLQLARAVSGRPLPSLDLDARDAELASLRAQVARLQARELRADLRGHASHGVLATIVALAAVVMLAAGCPPRPTPEPGPSQPVSGWTSTARAVLSTLRWALPAARAVTDSLLSDPPRTQVARALDAAADAAGRLDVALSAYESRGGDRCVAHAAAGGVVVALEQLADVLADNGIALGVVLGRVVDGAASIVDALVPACAADAGWTSAGDLANGRLRLTEDVARRRGIALRRDLDTITEPAQ